MRKTFGTVALIFAMAISGISTASADTLIFATNSNEDRKQPADMNYRYEPMSVSVNVMDSNKGEIIIKANFSSALSPTSFLNYSGAQPLLRIKILNNLTTFKGDTGYIWLEAPNTQPYQGSTRIDAVSSIYNDTKLGPSGGRKSLSYCKPKTWMDSGASSNWVAFSIDRNCADVNDMFWVVGYMDSDIWNSTYMFDSKYFPVEPFLVNMASVARPPKMKDQYVAYNAVIPQEKMENAQTTVQINSTSGLPVLVATSTGSVCMPTINGMTMQIQFRSSGVCKVEAYSLGNSVYNPSERAFMSFYIAPYVMQSQEIYWDEPYDVMVGDEDFDLFIYTSAKLPITVFSQSPEVCQFRDSTNPSMVTIVGAGYCRLSVNQVGNDRYYSRSATASFFVEKAPVVKPSSTPSPRPTRVKSTAAAAPKVFSATKKTETQQDINTKKNTGSVSNKAQTKSTITCYKGVLTKKVDGAPPKCPTGWKIRK